MPQGIVDESLVSLMPQGNELMPMNCERNELMPMNCETVDSEYK